MEKHKADAASAINPQDTNIFDLILDIFVDMDSFVKLEHATVSFVNKLSRLFGAGKVSFMMLDENTGELSIQAAQGLDPALSLVKVKPGESFSSKVAKEAKPLLVRDVETEFPESPRSRLSRYASRSFVIVPVEINDKVLGVISITDRINQSAFTEGDLRILKLLSRYFAAYIENRKLKEKSATFEIIDPLTELYNYRYFHEQLLEEISRCERYKRPLNVMIVDIDRFSEYSEDYGYAAADSVLKQVSKLLKANVRQVDVVCRYGLDEFAVILPETKVKEAVFVGDKLREIIGSSVFTENESRNSPLSMARLTVSVGIAEHSPGLTREELIRQAQGALLNAQENGRNCVWVFK